MPTMPTTPVPTTNLDAGTDTPKNARADLKTLIDTVNAIMACYGSNGGIPIKDADGKTIFDTNFFTQISGGNPIIQLDSGNYLKYDRTTDTLILNGGSEVAIIPNNPLTLAYRATTPQSINPSTNTVIQFNSETFDTRSFYDAATTFRFQPNDAKYYGYYRISAAVMYNATEAGKMYEAMIRVDGTNAISTDRITTPSGFTSGIVLKPTPILWAFNGTNYCEIVTAHNSATAKDVNSAAGTFVTYEYVRPL